ncbi:multicopper oxidase family protein [Streptomyces venezuelae ATCC 10712]
MISRRSVLGGALAAAGLPLLAPGSPAGGEAHAVEGLPPAGPRRAPDPVPAAFTTAMPVPRVLRPLASTGDVDCYELTIRKTTAEILPGFSTDVLTYDGHFPGPVIHARSGRRVLVRHHNGLQMPVAVHLHGGMVPPASDGNPMDVFAPGTSRTYTYTNRQPHASLWFHDHAHHMESEHVYRGLSGTYLLTDDLEQSLPLPKGQYDVPITLRDARFDEKGRLAYTMADRNRTTLLANGRPTPYFQVAARKYRFRLLNGANLRILALALSDGTPSPRSRPTAGCSNAPSPCPSSRSRPANGPTWSSTSPATRWAPGWSSRTAVPAASPSRSARSSASTWCGPPRTPAACPGCCGTCRPPPRWPPRRSPAASS